jgi:hypothetical protein
MKHFQIVQKQIKESMTDELVTRHCKAEGPVSTSSLLDYVNEQHAKAVTLDEIRESIARLVAEDTIEQYEIEDTWW